MPYRIAGTESLNDAVRRIAWEQVGRAIDEVDDTSLDPAETVHQVRKRCKKMRGLLRLVRFELGEKIYGRENACFRDAAKLLSSARDSEVRLQTFDGVLDRFGSTLAREAFDDLRSRLAERQDGGREHGDEIAARLSEFRDRMRRARSRVDAWPALEDGFDALEGGLATTYSRGRKAMRRAYAAPSGERFHEWRKRAKYHLYHTRLLRCLWDAPMKARRDEAERLSDCLGDDHDLVVLRSTLASLSCQRAETESVRTMLGLIDRRSLELTAEAYHVGCRLYADKPKRLVQRWEAYWNARQRELDLPAQLAAESPDTVSGSSD